MSKIKKGEKMNQKILQLMKILATKFPILAKIYKSLRK